MTWVTDLLCYLLIVISVVVVAAIHIHIDRGDDDDG